MSEVVLGILTILYIFQILLTIATLTLTPEEFDNKCSVFKWLFIPIIPVLIVLFKGLKEALKNFKELDSCK